jgi:hypothetical protein
MEHSWAILPDAIFRELWPRKREQFIQRAKQDITKHIITQDDTTALAESVNVVFKVQAAMLNIDQNMARFLLQSQISVGKYCWRNENFLFFLIYDSCPTEVPEVRNFWISLYFLKFISRNWQKIH